MKPAHKLAYLRKTCIQPTSQESVHWLVSTPPVIYPPTRVQRGETEALPTRVRAGNHVRHHRSRRRIGEGTQHNDAIHSDANVAARRKHHNANARSAHYGINPQSAT